jgi:RimJ/RimL family protein N-acetyltransferase
MNIPELCIVNMSPENAHKISQWRYDGIYSFYNHNGQNIASFMDGTHYACIDANETLIGYFCFGTDARIPTIEESVYDDGFMDIGLGLRPDLCGDGLGITFLNLGLNYAREYLGYEKFRLSVAAFNNRAICVYMKAGFCKKREVTNSYFKNKFYIMTLNKE